VIRDGFGSFIVIEGIDGSGKSTLAASIATRFADAGGVFIHRKTVPEDDAFVAKQMRGLAKVLWHEADGMRDNLLPPEYWVHLQAAWYAAFTQRVLYPALKRSRLVFVDGWHYKLQAKLMLSGFTRRYLDLVFNKAGTPDKVVLLDVDAELAWQRRSQFRPAEMGLHNGYETLGRESFVKFQSGAATKLRRFARRLGWATVAIRHDQSLEETTNLLQTVLDASQGNRMKSRHSGKPETSEENLNS
jgi:dTMP kinase